MTSQPFSSAALHGAVDLSALRRPPAPPGGAGGAAGPGAGPGPGGAGAARDEVVVTGTDATFQDSVTTSLRVPVVVVLWAAQVPQSRELVDAMASASRRSGGRFQVVSVDIDANLGLRQALAVERVPMCVAVIQGQPVPLFVGMMPDADIDNVIEQVLAMAVQNGVTGRVGTGGPDEAVDDEPDELPAHLEAAYAAIEADDLETAVAVYETALAADPTDQESKVGLAQVRLLQRTRTMDAATVRANAAQRPLDVGAQVQVADLDMAGGHVEDAFARLLDVVRGTSGEERNAARDHLLELFDLVGGSDPRVVAARRALMSALF